MAGRQEGLAIVELVLTLPVLVLVVYGGFEFSRALQYRQIAAALSREAASIGYRECLADPAGDPASTWIDDQYDALYMGACLTGQLTRLQPTLDRLVPGSQLLLSVYRTNPAGASTQFTRSSPGAYATRFSRQGANVVGPGGVFTLNSREYIIVSEIYVRFHGFFPFIWSSGGAPEGFYDSAVL